MEDVANCFNQFFVNVRPGLAGKIPDPETSEEHFNKLREILAQCFSGQWMRNKYWKL